MSKAMSSNGRVSDFRLTSRGRTAYLLLLDGDGREVQRLSLSFISTHRLATEAAAAADMMLTTIRRRER